MKKTKCLITIATILLIVLISTISISISLLNKPKDETTIAEPVVVEDINKNDNEETPITEPVQEETTEWKGGPAIVYVEDPNGPGESFYNTQAWSDFSKSEYVVDKGSINWTISGSDYNGIAEKGIYSIEIIYYEETNDCVIFVSGEDPNETVAEFR